MPLYSNHSFDAAEQRSKVCAICRLNYLTSHMCCIIYYLAPCQQNFL